MKNGPELHISTAKICLTPRDDDNKGELLRISLMIASLAAAVEEMYSQFSKMSAIRFTCAFEGMKRAGMFGRSWR
jgi:hypothetical protein